MRLGQKLRKKARRNPDTTGSFDPWVRKTKTPMEVEMATHSSILAWKIPWTEEPGRLQSKESDMTERLSTHRQETGVSLTWV